MQNSPLQKHIRLENEEKILLVTHKHWFIFTVSAIRILLIAIIPFILLTLFSSSIVINPHIPTFFISLWMLGMWLTLFTAWTNYRLDMWIVTDKRIININQIGLFAREVSTLRIERVQDIEVERFGIFASLFDFGDIRIQNAGPDAHDYTIKGVPRPQNIRDITLECVDHVYRERNLDLGRKM